MDNIIRKTNNQEETMAIGERLGQLLTSGMCIALKGDLGAGKTTFTKGIARGLKVKREVNSPTFTIMKIYQGELTLYHMDAYRLEGMHQDLGFEEYIEGDGVSVIEWPEYIEELLPQAHLAVSIKYVNEQVRDLEFVAHGEQYQRLLEEFV